LQGERRRATGQRAGIDLSDDVQPRAVAQLLEIEVPPAELYLLGDEDNVSAAVAQALAEQVAQLFDRPSASVERSPHPLFEPRHAVADTARAIFAYETGEVNV
jgi:hypothetical protein